MSVTAQRGILSWGPQVGKETVSTVFYQHRAANIDLAAISDDRLGPPEVGGIPIPTNPYRAGLVVAGGADFSPRLENTFGWVLHGAMGSWSAATQAEDVFGTTTNATDFVHHTFKFSTDAGYLPWMSFRKFIPGTNETNQVGETYEGCRVIGLGIALTTDDLLSTRVDVVGRKASFNYGATGFTYANTEFEDYHSIPIGCTVGGYVKVPSFSTDAAQVVQAMVMMQNGTLDLRQEKIFGSPYLQDITILNRALTIDMVVKWEGSDLYNDIYTGATNGTEWTAAPWVQDLDIYALSPHMATTHFPYQLRIEAESVMYQVVGGITLGANQAIFMRLRGTAIAPSSGDYAKIHLGNKSTSYLWPT